MSHDDSPTALTGVPDLLDKCLDCGHAGFDVIERDGNAVFLCASCGTGWRYGLGHLVRTAEHPVIVLGETDPVA